MVQEQVQDRQAVGQVLVQVAQDLKPAVLVPREILFLLLGLAVAAVTVVAPGVVIIVAPAEGVSDRSSD